MLDLVLPLVAALAAGDTANHTPRRPGPAAAAAQPASVVVHRQPAVPLVALRLSLLADDPPGYAGAGHLVQHLVQARLHERVEQVGGRLQVQRTSDAVVYTVLGPARELDHLAAALREVLRPPTASEAELLLASRELAEERLAEWETAERHLRSALRMRLFPGDISAAGTESSAKRLLGPGALEEAWAQLYRPERISVIAVGDVQLEQVQAAFSELPPAPGPAAPGPEIERDTVSARPLAPAEATQAWLGAGYLATEVDAPALSVAARLIQDHLESRLPTASVTSEHWWTHYGQALVVVVATPGTGMAAAQRALGTAVAGTEREVSEERVRAAAAAVRREMLFYARTPERMAEVLGRFTDRLGDPDAADDFYAYLDEVDAAQVRTALRTLLQRSAVRVDLPPQRLRRP